MGLVEFTSASVAEVIAYVPVLFTDLWLIVALAIGLPLSFWAIRKVIGLVRMR